MILTRRKLHFYVVAMLTGILPVVFLAGLIWRPSIPMVDESKDELFARANFPTPGKPQTILTSAVVMVEDTEVKLASVVMDNGEPALIVQPTQALRFADILVYWTPGDQPVVEITDQEILLGQLSGDRPRRLPLPPIALTKPGQLVFYSRGPATVIVSVSVPSPLLP